MQSGSRFPHGDRVLRGGNLVWLPDAGARGLAGNRFPRRMRGSLVKMGARLLAVPAGMTVGSRLPKTIGLSSPSQNRRCD
jgi:hypothetical protein